MNNKLDTFEDVYGISSILYNKEGSIICSSSKIKDTRHFSWLKDYQIDLTKVTLVIHHTKIGAVIIPFNHQILVIGNMFIGTKNEYRLRLILHQKSSNEEKYLKGLQEISLSEIKRISLLISRMLNDTEMDFVMIEEENSISQKIKLSDNEEYGLVENYRIQEKIIDCIKQGSPDGLKQLIKYETFSKREYTLSEQKINFIRLSALVSKASYEGGLGLNEVNVLVDNYLKKVEFLNDPTKIHQLQNEMLVSMAIAVKVVNTKQFTHPLNRRIQEYLQLHVHENIDFYTMAEELKISKNHMLSTFKKEAGQSLVDYMYQLKIKEATILIHQNELTISQISAYLGFSSHSYFTKWFKKIMGMTPKQYLSK